MEILALKIVYLIGSISSFAIRLPQQQQKVMKKK